MSTDVQFLVDSQGHKTAAVLPIEEYEMLEELEELMVDLHLRQVVSESKNELRRPLAEVLEEMHKNHLTTNV